MANRIWEQLRGVPVVGDWLTNWNVRRQLSYLKNRYLPLIQEADKAENTQRSAELTAEWAVERESVLDPIYARNSAKLITKALKYGITVPPQEPDSRHYRRSGITGEFILRQPAYRRLRRDLRNEQRARNDEFRKWATVVFALLAFVLGLTSLVLKTKQPDACPRNYYRSDSGACTFALSPEGKALPPEKAPVPNKSAPTTNKNALRKRSLQAAP